MRLREVRCTQRPPHIVKVVLPHEAEVEGHQVGVKGAQQLQGLLLYGQGGFRSSRSSRKCRSGRRSGFRGGRDGWRCRGCWGGFPDTWLWGG